MMSSSFYLVIIESTAFATSSELTCTSPDLTKPDRKVIVSFHWPINMAGHHKLSIL